MAWGIIGDAMVAYFQAPCAPLTSRSLAEPNSKPWAASLLCCLFLGLAGCPGRTGGDLYVSGQIEGTTVEAGSRVGGRVEEVLVDEGDGVKAGDVLVRLETPEAKAMHAVAKAQEAQAVAVLAKLEAGARPEEISRARAVAFRMEKQYQMALRGARSQEINVARAGMETARAQRDEAKAEFERIRTLYEEHVVSQQVFDQANHHFEAAVGSHKGTMENLDLLVQGTRDEQIAMAKASHEEAKATLEELENGARIEDLAAARAARDAATANVMSAAANLREMTVSAPLDGVVESIDLHPGDLVRPGPIVSIVDPEDLELTVYVSAKWLGHLRLGQTLQFTTDSHDDETFSGAIIYIASQGEFTPRNLQTQEERVQQVFGVKIQLDSASGKLRAGMTATVRFDGVS